MPLTGLLRLARNDGRNCRHCEEQSDKAIPTEKALPSSTVEPVASPALTSGPLAMTLEPSSLRGAKRRSNPDGKGPPLDCFASLAMTGGSSLRGAKRRSNPDGKGPSHWVASLRSQ
ncbi:MAG: hypothetical protein LBT00_11700 [Spirochaetaceae bacterium]|nr:hypothetical protein [Spirochaetaceae bacterium]